MVVGQKETTKSGNLKAPPMEIFLEWVVLAWQSVSAEVIKHSFDACGISINTDGSQDDLIHCFKV